MKIIITKHVSYDNNSSMHKMNTLRVRCFDIQLNTSQVEILVGNSNNETIDHNNNNITSDFNTMMNDWIEEKYVMEKCRNGCCLWSDLEEFVRNLRMLKQ
jgi:hypothetical protein